MEIEATHRLISSNGEEWLLKDARSSYYYFKVGPKGAWRGPVQGNVYKKYEGEADNHGGMWTLKGLRAFKGNK